MVSNSNILQIKKIRKIPLIFNTKKWLWISEFWKLRSSRGVTIRSRAKMNFCSMLGLGSFFEDGNKLKISSKITTHFKKLSVYSCSDIIINILDFRWYIFHPNCRRMRSRAKINFCRMLVLDTPISFGLL